MWLDHTLTVSGNTVSPVPYSEREKGCPSRGPRAARCLLKQGRGVCLVQRVGLQDHHHRSENLGLMDFHTGPDAGKNGRAKEMPLFTTGYLQASPIQGERGAFGNTGLDQALLEEVLSDLDRLTNSTENIMELSEKPVDDLSIEDIER